MAVLTQAAPFRYAKRAQNPLPEDLPEEVLEHLEKSGFGPEDVTDCTVTEHEDWFWHPKLGMQLLPALFLRLCVCGRRQPLLFRAKAAGSGTFEPAGAYRPSLRKNLVT